MQSLLKFTKDWGYTALGLFTLVVIMVFSVYFTYLSHVSVSTLAPTDIDRLLSSDFQIESSQAVESIVTTKPVRLLLPSVNLAVNIDDATINTLTNEWPLSSNSAQYADFTPGLGSQKGTMLIYGHNTWAVMRKTGDLNIGDELALIDQNKKVWKFTLTREENIVPQDVGFIYEDVAFRVVMFTCNGWNDQYRRLMFFSPAY